MAKALKWGILATGGIARQFAGGLRVSQTGTLHAVGSRSLEKAEKFAAEFGGKPFGSYTEVLNDPEIDAVYIATPHHLHETDTIAAAQAGKAILCEKPFTLNLAEAKRALEVVRENDVFFMEAFMYRCHPQTRQIKKWVDEGSIGQLQAIRAEFSFGAGREWANFRTDASAGGGGLMDVGVYPISLCRLLAGEPDVALYTATLSTTGYDEWGAGCLHFPNGVTAAFAAGIHCSMTNDAWVFGEQGRIHVSDPWKVGPDSTLTLYRNGYDPETQKFGVTNDELYGIEADAVAEFIEAKECPYMTLADTLNQAEAIDKLKASAGLKF